MLRLRPPLLLLAAALTSGQAHAQVGDRYGPSAAVPAPALRGAPAAAAPALRSLSWPGKSELRPALAAPAPAAFPAPQPSAPGGGRYPGVGVYAAAPALRTGAAPARTPVSSGWTSASRTSRRSAPPLEPTTAYAAPTAPSGLRPAPYLRASAQPGPAYAPVPATAPAARPARLTTYASTAPVAAPTAVFTRGSTLPSGLAAPPAYVAPGPATVPMLAEEARAAAAPVADTLPPPTVGRYGYVGPGRSDPAATPYPTASLATVRTRAPGAPTASPVAGPTVPPPATQPGAALGPPRPPAYARAYVLPQAQSQTAPTPSATGAPAPQPAPTASAETGGRRYSLHREYGLEPDPAPVPPQFFSATADLSAPEMAPAALRTRAAVNAARLAATDP